MTSHPRKPRLHCSESLFTAPTTTKQRPVFSRDSNGTALGGEHAAEEGLHLVVQRGVRDPAIIDSDAERWLLVLLCELLCRDRRYSLLVVLVVVVEHGRVDVGVPQRGCHRRLLLDRLGAQHPDAGVPVVVVIVRDLAAAVRRVLEYGRHAPLPTLLVAASPLLGRLMLVVLLLVVVRVPLARGRRECVAAVAGSRAGGQVVVVRKRTAAPRTRAHVQWSMLAAPARAARVGLVLCGGRGGGRGGVVMRLDDGLVVVGRCVDRKWRGKGRERVEGEEVGGGAARGGVVRGRSR